MQHVKFLVHSYEVAPGLKILFKEGNGNVAQRDYVIEAKDANNTQHFKSFFYVEKFPIYSQRETINRWLNNLITTEELKKILE